MESAARRDEAPTVEVRIRSGGGNTKAGCRHPAFAAVEPTREDQLLFLVYVAFMLSNQVLPPSIDISMIQSIWFSLE